MQNMIQLPKDLYDAVRKKALARKTSPENLVVEWVSERLNDDEEAQTDWLTALKAEAEVFA